MEMNNYKLPEGISLTLHKPDGGDNLPAVILCHGFCGIKEILLPAFAQAFAKAGFAAITFDYRGFGDSEGERGRLVPAMQIEDILTVVEWAKSQAEIDSSRIALWGTSFGGCHVFEAAVRSADIKGVISQLAFADGEELVTGNMTAEEKTGFISTLNKMADKKQATGKEMMVAITKVLSDEESKTFFEMNKVRYPQMDIKIPFLTVRETLLYKPAASARQVTCPVLVVIAGSDSVNPPEQGRALFEAVDSENKQLYVEEQARHYDMYSGQHFDNAIRVQIDWLHTWL